LAILKKEKNRPGCLVSILHIPMLVLGNFLQTIKKEAGGYKVPFLAREVAVCR